MRQKGYAESLYGLTSDPQAVTIQHHVGSLVVKASGARAGSHGSNQGPSTNIGMMGVVVGLVGPVSVYSGSDGKFDFQLLSQRCSSSKSAKQIPSWDTLMLGS